MKHIRNAFNKVCHSVDDVCDIIDKISDHPKATKYMIAALAMGISLKFGTTTTIREDIEFQNDAPVYVAHHLLTHNEEYVMNANTSYPPALEIFVNSKWNTEKITSYDLMNRKKSSTDSPEEIAFDKIPGPEILQILKIGREITKARIKSASATEIIPEPQLQSLLNAFEDRIKEGEQILGGIHTPTSPGATP